MRTEQRIAGLGVSAGIAIGPAVVLETGFARVPQKLLPPEAVEVEIERLAQALAKAKRQLTKLITKSQSLPEQAAADIGGLMEAHLGILSGARFGTGIEARIREHRLNAEYAVQQEIAGLTQLFESMDDPYMAARVQDIRDVGARIIRNLVKKTYRAFSDLVPGSILLAEEITPADTALMDPSRIGGFASVLGGAAGHTAIMARSLGLPAVVGATGLLAGVASGRTVIVNGLDGTVVIDPGPETLAEYQDRQAALNADRVRLRHLIGRPAHSRDGVVFSLQVNLDMATEVGAAIGVGADGIGLLRTEFLYMNRDDLPDEEEQFAHLREIVAGMEGRPVTIRTMDIGAEKVASALKPHFADVMNPALGLRAIRLSLRETGLMRAQLGAMLRAGAYGPIRILLPMVISPEEVHAARSVLAETHRDLRARGLAQADHPPPLGVMIEVPAAAAIADALARVSDFFAVGTNDLAMYTLAVDRGDDQVADLYDPMHPAVLRLIGQTVDAALRAGIPVSVCGEMAGDPAATVALAALGVTELSMAPNRLLPVKGRVETLTVSAARTEILAALEARPEAVAATVAALNRS